MAIVVVSPAAIDDLNAIWQHIGLDHGNADAANSILREIRDVILLLPKTPRIGRACTELQSYAANLRCITVRSYIMYYELDDPLLRVARIVHQRQDQANIMLQ